MCVCVCVCVRERETEERRENREEREERVAAQEKTVKLGGTRFPGHPEDVLYEIELEDMCEEGPSTWEDQANQKWE